MYVTFGIMLHHLWGSRVFGRLRVYLGACAYLSSHGVLIILKCFRMGVLSKCRGVVRYLQVVKFVAIYYKHIDIL
jgi:hypothetical protein